MESKFFNDVKYIVINGDNISKMYLGSDVLWEAPVYGDKNQEYDTNVPSGISLTAVPVDSLKTSCKLMRMSLSPRVFSHADNLADALHTQVQLTSMALSGPKYEYRTCNEPLQTSVGITNMVLTTVNL